VNWFSYGANNPLRFLDPSGLETVEVQENDALWKIKDRHNKEHGADHSLDDWIEANPQLENPDVIHEGNQINVPGVQDKPVESGEGTPPSWDSRPSADLKIAGLTLLRIPKLGFQEGAGWNYGAGAVDQVLHRFVDEANFRVFPMGYMVNQNIEAIGTIVMVIENPGKVWSGIVDAWKANGTYFLGGFTADVAMSLGAGYLSAKVNAMAAGNVVDDTARYAQYWDDLARISHRLIFG